MEEYYKKKYLKYKSKYMETKNGGGKSKYPLYPGYEIIYMNPDYLPCDSKGILYTLNHINDRIKNAKWCINNPKEVLGYTKANCKSDEKLIGELIRLKEELKTPQNNLLLRVINDEQRRKTEEETQREWERGNVRGHKFPGNGFNHIYETSDGDPCDIKGVIWTEDRIRQEIKNIENKSKTQNMYVRSENEKYIKELRTVLFLLSDTSRKDVEKEKERLKQLKLEREERNKEADERKIELKKKKEHELWTAELREEEERMEILREEDRRREEEQQKKMEERRTEQERQEEERRKEEERQKNSWW